MRKLTDENGIELPTEDSVDLAVQNAQLCAELCVASYLGRAFKLSEADEERVLLALLRSKRPELADLASPSPARARPLVETKLKERELRIAELEAALAAEKSAHAETKRERDTLAEQIAQVEIFTWGNIGIHWAEENDRLREQRDALVLAITQLQHLNQCAAGDDCETCGGISQHALLNGKAQEIPAAHDAEVQRETLAQVKKLIDEYQHPDAADVCCDAFLDQQLKLLTEAIEREFAPGEPEGSIQQ